MSEMLKTLVFAAAALVFVGAAYVGTRDNTRLAAAFDDQGKPFFPDFKDPLQCTDLEVVSFDASTATASRFHVMFKDGKWVIPSHYNYPADAKDRLTKTAAAVMDLTKDTIRSDLADDQEPMGVIDPLDAKSPSVTGRGQRIILKDSTEKVLADFVIGKEVKGIEHKEGSTPQRYVRVPDQKRIYGVSVKADLSTRFADWIETNLLKVESSKIRKIVFDNYKIQEGRDARGPFVSLARGEILTIERKDANSPWTMADVPAGQELNEDKIRALNDALADLKIVGVRPRPPGLKNPNDPALKLSPIVIASLRNKGFFLTEEGLYSDQGDVIVSTDEGVVYTLRYGGAVYGVGDELTAGAPDDAETKDDPKKAKPKATEAAQESRYLLVTVAFDPTLIPKPESLAPKPVSIPKGPVDIPDKPFAPDPKDPKSIAEQKEAADKADREKADYEKKVADGEKRVKDLIDRFGPWYFVTPGDSFRAINLDRAILTQPKKPPGAAGAPGGLPGGMPGGFPMPGGGGLPRP